MEIHFKKGTLFFKDTKKSIKPSKGKTHQIKGSREAVTTVQRVSVGRPNIYNMGGHKLHVRFVPKSKYNNKPYKPQDLEPIIIACLHRLYPLLLLLDQVLDKMMWNVDDIPLQFIYIILLCYTVSLVLPRDTSMVFQTFDIWIGFASASILFMTCVYFHITLSRELEHDEAPTLDEITHTLESVLEKLNTLQNEVLGENKSRKFITFDTQMAKLIIVCTFFHFLAVSTLGVRKYLMLGIILISAYHSVHYQGMLKLLWRHIWVRRLYYWLWRNNRSLPDLKSAEFEADVDGFLTVISERQLIPYPKSLQGVNVQELQIQLQMLILQDPKTIDPKSDYVHVKIVEFRIDENERKWKEEGWTSQLLPYERTHFCSSFTGRRSVSPWKFQEDLSPEWIWIDSNWIPGSWRFCDGQWQELGAYDSVASFTRSRTWKRRAFQLMN